MVAAAERLGCKLTLEEDGPYFHPPKVVVTDIQRDAIIQLRRVLHNHRSALIRYLGGDPRKYAWAPIEGSEERKWYDFIESCLKDEPGIYQGESGKRWHSLKDAQRLLESCENTEAWKNEARCFWWDCTHAAMSWKAVDYDWPLLR
jgi:hypothetical protein